MTRHARIAALTGAAALLIGVLGMAVASAAPAATPSAPKTQHSAPQKHAPTTAEAPDSAENADAENADAEKQGAETASPTESDGPGGHEDPAGNVDHQFEGEE